MKRFIYLFALASLFACSSNEELSPPSNSIELVSKASDYSYIKEGRRIGVTISGISDNYVNRPWTAGADGGLTATNPAPNWGEDDITIAAYHPHNSQWTDVYSGQMFTVSEDQSTDGTGYQDSDLMWCSVTALASQAKEAISLTFEHKLAQIDIKVTGLPIGSDVTVYVCNTYPAVWFNPYGGNVGSYDGEKKMIKAYVTANQETITASAIIVPQEVYAETKFIRVETGDKTYYYTLKEGTNFVSGATYKYQLTVPANADTETRALKLCE